MDSQSDKTKEPISDMSAINEAKTCCICLTEVKNRAMTDTCRHEFCFDCIRVWSEEHNRCPICRQVYQNIVHNISSDRDHQLLAVAEQPDGDDEDIDVLLRRMLLYLRIIGLRNRAQRQRDTINDELQQQLERTPEKDRNRDFRADVRQKQRDINELDREINQLNIALSMDSPTEEDLILAVENRDQISEYEVIEVIQQIADMDENEELVPPVVEVEVSVEFEDESEESSNDSGNESDDEDSEDETDRQSNTRPNKRRADSDSSDEELSDDYMKNKRRK